MSTYQLQFSKLQVLEKDMDSFLDELQLDTKDLQIDHIGMKFNEQQDVDTFLSELLITGAKLVGQITMKGRIFRTIKLSEPIIFMNKEIYGIELPDVKPGANRSRIGFEHIEFFFDKDIFTTEDLEKYFLNYFPNYNKSIEYNLELPGVEDQLPNPTLCFEDKTRELEIKFHAKSIFEIIEG